jgi:hypothetical protein
VFDSYGNERLIKWKQFRDQLEDSQTPLEDLADFWAKAPFVNSYINPLDTTAWPDPWHLILDNRYDDLAIVLGMLYTLKLTQRFIDVPYEIHMSMPQTDKNNKFFLVLDQTHVLNLSYREVVGIDSVKDLQTSTICKGSSLP